jgi:glycosyltransferase involved in cell wall biosynthesis
VDTKVLCIFTTILGHKTMARKLMGVLNGIPGLAIQYILVDNEDYVRYPAPWWARASNPWQAEFIAQQKAKPLIGGSYDILFVNAWELAVAFHDLAKKTPAAVILDAVPATVNEQQRLQGKTGWKRMLSDTVHHRAFSKAARDFDFFLPMGSDCASSLAKDYSVPHDCIAISLTPQDLEKWDQSAKNYSPPLRLLFVGKDFIRKGGDFLLRLFAQRLSGKCILTIVSDHAGLDKRVLPGGVERLGHISSEHLIQLFHDSHLFVFPTQQDYLPQVLAEASAAGLPCIANDVGAVRDLVHDGKTGFLMNRHDPINAWADRIDQLLANPAKLESMSRAARQFAEDKLSYSRFESLISNVVERLRTCRKD